MVVYTFFMFLMVTNQQGLIISEKEFRLLALIGTSRDPMKSLDSLDLVLCEGEQWKLNAAISPEIA